MFANLNIFSTLLIACLVRGSEATQNQYPFSILRSRSSQNATGKANRLAVLGLINKFNTPFSHFPYRLPGYLFNESFTTAMDSPDSRRCILEGANYTLHKINSNADFLRDFELEMHYFPGTDMSPLSGLNLVANYFSEIENLSSDSSKLINSRIVIGPTTSCESQLSYTIDLTMAAVRRVFKMKRLFSTKCGLDVVNPISNSLIIWSRNQYDYSTLALLNFAKTVGNWQQIGVISGNALQANSAAYFISQLNRCAGAGGIKVVHIGFDIDYYNMFAEVKEKSRARIVLLMSYAESCVFCVYVWCTSHRAGIRAPKFVVLLPNAYCSTCLSDNVRIPNGLKLASGRPFEICEKSVQVEQSRIFFYSDIVDNVNQYNQVNEPYEPFSSRAYLDGVIINETELREAEETAGCTENDNRWGNIVESLLSAALIMDLTDRSLKERLNTSLLNEIEKGEDDLITETSRRVTNELAYLSNQSTATLKDMNEYYVLQASRERPYILTRTSFVESDEKCNLNFSVDKVTTLQPVKWATLNFKAPKDLSNILEIRGDVNSFLAFTISGAAIFLCCLQIAAVSVASFQTSKGKASFYYDYTMNGVILAGCFVANISVVILLVGTVIYLPQMCPWRPFLIIICLTQVHGGLFSKIEAVPTYISLNRYVSSAIRHSPEVEWRVIVQQRRSDFKQLKLNVTKGFASIVLLTTLAVLIWFLVDPMSWTYVVHFHDDPLFDAALDTYYDIRIEYCTSIYQNQLTWAFVIFHFVMLFTGSFVAISVKRSAKYLRKRFATDVLQTRLGTVNAAASFTLFIIINVLLSNFPPQRAYLQITAISIGLLWHSTSTSAIILYPVLLPLRRGKVSNKVGFAHSNSLDGDK